MNSYDALVKNYTSDTISQLVKGIRAGTYDWDHYYESLFQGQFDEQMHYDLFNGTSPAALYWSHSAYPDVNKENWWGVHDSINLLYS